MITQYNKYSKKSFILRKRAEEILYEMPNVEQWRNYYLSYTLVSDIWQNWCSFCKDIIICSCSGTLTRTGRSIAARPGTNDWKRISYEINQAKFGRTAHADKQIRFLRQEPTWGDQNLLLTTIPVLNPSNAPSLLAGFGLPVYAPKHIQTVRNSCAHTNSETLADVRRLLPFYTGGGFSHPLDILWWTESTSNSLSIFHWLDELEVVATQVTM